MVRQFDGLYRFYGGQDWQWFKALAMVESGENPYAIGDSGLAVGLFQMHTDFWMDYGVSMADWRWVPAIAMRALRRFWEHWHSYRAEIRCLIFHYGFGRFQGLQGADPDGYLERLRQAMGEIAKLAA